MAFREAFDIQVAKLSPKILIKMSTSTSRVWRCLFLLWLDTSLSLFPSESFFFFSFALFNYSALTLLRCCPFELLFLLSVNNYYWPNWTILFCDPFPGDSLGFYWRDPKGHTGKWGEEENGNMERQMFNWNVPG